MVVAPGRSVPGLFFGDVMSKRGQAGAPSVAYKGQTLWHGSGYQGQVQFAKTVISELMAPVVASLTKGFGMIPDPRTLRLLFGFVWSTDIKALEPFELWANQINPGETVTDVEKLKLYHP